MILGKEIEESLEKELNAKTNFMNEGEENSVQITAKKGVNEALKNLKIPGTTIVRTVDDAKSAI